MKHPKTFVTIIIVCGFGFLLFGLAKRDVETHFPHATIRLNGVHPSKTHLLYFSFELDGDQEISRAHWRLTPFRHVEVEK